MKKQENDIEQKKTCKKCQMLKTLNQFGKNKKCKDRLDIYCKTCIKTKNNLNKEYLKNWKAQNPHKVEQGWRKFQKTDKSKIYQKTYLKNNKEKDLKYKRKYRLDNLEERRRYEREWRKEKLKNDIVFKLKDSLRNQFYNALKNGKKFESILNIIGCSIEELKQHLEQQFKPEMTWENHGIIWEIDHIKQIYSFDLNILEQQKQCFHYINLQPLFKTTEIAKSFGYINEIGNRNKNKY